MQRVNMSAPILLLFISISAFMADAIATQRLMRSNRIVDIPSNAEVHSKLAFVQHVDSMLQETTKDLSSLLPVLPKSLYNLGVSTLGSEEKLDNFLKKLKGPQNLTDDGLHLIMFAVSGDTTMPRLAVEFSQDEYGLEKVGFDPGIIVDVGGNIGDFAISAWKRWPYGQVLALEPVPTTFMALMINLYLNNVTIISEEDLGKKGKPGVVALNKALTADGRDITVTVNETDTQDAYVLSSWQTNDLPVQYSVKSISFPEYLASHEVDAIRLLKMDCEGCEFEAIPAMSSFFTNKSKVHNFAGEIHKFREPWRTMPEDKIHALDEQLLSRGCNKYMKAWWEGFPIQKC